MDSAAERAVERVIKVMRDKLGEQLSIDDMARVAMFSKFHFSRIFQRVTGVSPGRFLSALRLQQAKQLLVSTSFNVSDISLRVGYTSVGTFSSRFTRSVGLSPTTFRRQLGVTKQIQTGVSSYVGDGSLGSVRGIIRLADPARPDLIFAGLFRDRIPEGRPAACAVLREPGPYLLEKVPPGAWYMLVHSIPADAVDSPVDSIHEPLVAVATYGPIVTRRDDAIEGIDVELKPMRSLDPPVLMALLDVRTAALELVAGRVARGSHSAAY